MLIREVMHLNPISASSETILSDAFNLMNEKNIRHLPVVSGDKIVGIVTDRDLRLATSKLAKHPIEPTVSISEVMSHPVETTHPSEPIEAATHRMRELKIGCLPVLENGKLVGIVTVADLLDSMLLLTGVSHPSGRLDVRLKDRMGEIARLTNLIASKKISIHSILSYHESNDKLRVVLRVSTIEMRSLAKAICEADFEVLWPIQISCVE